jgi:teichuronic acid biosynthesis glycosyltransferase TuaC
MKVLTISTLYPTRPRPHFGVFVKNRMVEVAKLVDELVVISPQPWFPLVHRFIEEYRHRDEVPSEDVVDGVRVLYPRFVSVPRYLKPLDPFSIALSLAVTLVLHPELRKADLFDIHCAYPDGLAGALVARLLGKPSTVTLRGHDINDVPQLYPVRRQEVKAALALVDRVFSVAKALADGAIELGTPADKCVVLSNGVDAKRFYPLDRKECRRRLGIPEEGRMVLGVGFLIKRKGYDLITRAVGELRRKGMTDLFAAYVGGPGDEPAGKDEIDALIERYDLHGHVLLPGRADHEELLYWYNAADVFCLASEKEGWANVILEALACGTPVVGTNVWGTPEVIRTPDVGILVERTAEAIEAGLAEALEKEWDRDRIVAYAREHSWEATARRVVEQFEHVLRSRGRGWAEAAARAGS